MVRLLYQPAASCGGKVSGKCLIPPGKQALPLDFFTFSTAFSTCGKIQGLLQTVYCFFVENFCTGQNGGICGPAVGRLKLPGGHISADRPRRRTGSTRGTFLAQSGANCRNFVAKAGELCYTSYWSIIYPAFRGTKSVPGARRALPLCAPSEPAVQACSDRNGRSTQKHGRT